MPRRCPDSSVEQELLTENLEFAWVASELGFRLLRDHNRRGISAAIRAKGCRLHGPRAALVAAQSSRGCGNRGGCSSPMQSVPVSPPPITMTSFPSALMNESPLSVVAMDHLLGVRLSETPWRSEPRATSRLGIGRSRGLRSAARQQQRIVVIAATALGSTLVAHVRAGDKLHTFGLSSFRPGV